MLLCAWFVDFKLREAVLETWSLTYSINVYILTRHAASTTSNFRLTLEIQHKLSNLMENLFLPMICKRCLLKGISGMQFSMQIWTHESQAACLAHEKHVQIVGNSKIYFTILIYFYHHIVTLRCVAARACTKEESL